VLNAKTSPWGASWSQNLTQNNFVPHNPTVGTLRQGLHARSKHWDSDRQMQTQQTTNYNQPTETKQLSPVLNAQPRDYLHAWHVQHKQFRYQKPKKTTQLCTAKPRLAHATFTQSESPASLHAQCLKHQTYSRYDYRTTANVSYTVNIQTAPFQKALETMYLKFCAIY
jgi:hypothetical protein